MRFGNRLSGLLSALLLLFAASGPGFAADDKETDPVRVKLVAAREKFSELKQMEAVYNEKKVISDQLMEYRDAHGELLSVIQALRIELDGYPAPGRMNSIQKGVYREWLAHHQTLNAINTDIRRLEGEIHRIDEAVLEVAANQLKRPGPSHRRDILLMYPATLDECKQRFEALRTVAKAAAQEGGKTEQEVIRDANAALNTEGEGDDRFGPSAPFFSALKQFSAGRLALDSRPKAKSKKRRN